MREYGTGCGTLLALAVTGVLAWMLGLDDVVRASIAAGHLLDWLMGIFCLLWLLALLKVPWDLYFQAQQVAFELQRAQERNIAVPADRAAYMRGLRRKLGWTAVSAHLFSAALIAAITYFSHGEIGYYFAVFYLVATVFRPAIALYVYLRQKLFAISEEAHYPREDIVALQDKVQWQQVSLRDLTDQARELREAIDRETEARETETRDLRHQLHALGREFEVTISRLSDNQEVIKGVQAFVRLIVQSTHTAS